MFGAHFSFGRIADATVSLVCLAMRFSPAEAEMARMAMVSLGAAFAAIFAVRRDVGALPSAAAVPAE